MPPAPVVSSSLLTAIKAIPHLPPNNWYPCAATALSTLNRPDQIGHVFTNSIENRSPDEQLTVARRTREALIKSSAIIGLPKTINALLALKAVTPKHLIDEPLGFNPSQRVIDVYQTSPSQIMQRGKVFFDQVYGKVTNRVMGQMDRSGSEDLGLIARLEYGYLLSPSHILTPAETSFVVLASLIPQDVNPQLKGHLIGALNNGAKETEVKAVSPDSLSDRRRLRYGSLQAPLHFRLSRVGQVRELVIKICEAAGMKRLEDGSLDSWGWREEVANLKPRTKESKL